MTSFETLKNLEEELWRPETRFDRNRMNELFAAEFYEIGCSGRRWNREELLAIGPREFRAELPLPEFAVRIIAENVALVTYRSVVEFGVELQQAHRVSVWEKTSDAWKLHFHQGTPYENDV